MKGRLEHSFQIEKNIKEILSKIKSLGFKRGLSIKPNTDINKLVPYLDDIDLILVMTVEPGLGGQQFLESSTKRLKEIKEKDDVIQHYQELFDERSEA